MDWVYYPKTNQLPLALKDVVDVFLQKVPSIDSTANDTNELRKKSDVVLALLCNSLQELGFEVETGKKKVEKIRVPVLFGEKGVTELAFEVDAWHKEQRIVIEIEAGRALINHQFLKDIFETSMMVDVDYLVLAVRRVYKNTPDYKKISSWLNTLFLTKRINLNLKGILLIGY